MLNINYSPLPFLFTSSLPTEIVITTEQPSVEITIECGRDTVFTTTLYPYNKQAVLYDIRSILEDYMLANALVHTPFMIFADDSQEYANTHQAEAIYCRVNLPNVGASYYIQSFFFNTLSAYTIPFDAVQMLTLFTIVKSDIPTYIESLVLPDNATTPHLVRTEQTTLTPQSSALTMHGIEISPSRIRQSLNTTGKLLSFTVHYGFLAKTFYVTYNTTYLTFLATNEFGCPEYIHLTCATKRKLDLNRSTATCLGTSTFYDDNTTYEYEVESSMLTIEEAHHISLLLLSTSISIVQDNTPTPIIITDITNEISDADNATNAIKFKYKYARHNLPISQSPSNSPKTSSTTLSTAHSTKAQPN